MAHTVLKTFPFSRDGVRIQQAVVGDTPDIPAGLVPGLVAAGYLGEGEPVTNPAPGGGVIPEDWRDLHHNKIIALAKQLGAEVSSKEEAVVAIEAHLGQAQS